MIVKPEESGVSLRRLWEAGWESAATVQQLGSSEGPQVELSSVRCEAQAIGRKSRNDGISVGF